MFSFIGSCLLFLVFLLFGVQLWKNANYLQNNGKTTEGTIIGNNLKIKARSNSKIYYPVVRFLTENKEWITQELNFGQNPPMSEGKKLTIIYDPNEPTNFDIKSTFKLVILPRLLIAIGSTGIIVAVLDYLEIINLSI